MKKLLFTISCIIITTSISAQDTYDIDWTFGSNSNVTPASASNNADRTIEVGDMVRWTWSASGNHNVVSNSGSQENFMSGTSATDTQPPGTVFSVTFNEVGVNDYRCNPHSGSMFGTITVVAEGTLSSKKFEDDTTFSIAPNPSKNWLNITLPSYNSELNIEVFDVLGKRVHKGKITQMNSVISVSNWNKGVYLVRVSNDKTTQTKRFIKQ